MKRELVVTGIGVVSPIGPGELHPTRNLENLMHPTLNWVKEASITHTIENALTLSMGFGGINTAMCWQRPQ